MELKKGKRDGKRQGTSSNMKRLLIVVMLFLLPSCLMAGGWGDVNQDGVVNITDLTCLIDHLLDDSIVISYECSDMNADGEITIGDVTGLIDLLLRGH